MITVYWQLGVCNSSLLKCPITSDLKCVKSNRPGNTVPPLTIVVAFCSRTGGLQRERKKQIMEKKMILIHKNRIKCSTTNNILAFNPFFFFFYLHLVFKINMFRDVHWTRYAEKLSALFIHATLVVEMLQASCKQKIMLQSM